MGRSVSRPSNAQVTCYQDVSEFEDQDDFQWFIDDIQEQCKAAWPSLTDCSKWLDREDHAILENGHCYIGVSEYCGLAAIWIVPKACEYYYSDDKNTEGLAARWIDRIRPKFEKLFGELAHLGTMSNGCGVYRKISD